jgi:UDP-glucuronate 4-epimerase
MLRDFTYIDDIVEGVVRIMEILPASSTADASSESSALHRIYNIGNNEPVELTRLIAILEKQLGKKAIQKLLPMQPGDVPTTYAEIDELSRVAGYRPHTPVEVGVGRFVEWYRQYYGV